MKQSDDKSRCSSASWIDHLSIAIHLQRDNLLHTWRQPLVNLLLCISQALPLWTHSAHERKKWARSEFFHIPTFGSAPLRTFEDSRYRLRLPTHRHQHREPHNPHIVKRAQPQPQPHKKRRRRQCLPAPMTTTRK